MNNMKWIIKMSSECAADYYDYENLKPNDKEKLDLLSDITNDVLSEENLDNYVSENYSGDKMKEVIKELLSTYNAHLKDAFEQKGFDCIIDFIDNYSVEEFEHLTTNGR